uniref:Glycosyl transferase family 2 n=1 Tax=Cyanothece sp. (strain PCC 7425 / ATCC 29141) TaxID=395961 RepID=B8HQ89_CYAP4
MYSTLSDPQVTDPQVTIVVVPRERFSFTRQSLESIYQYTDLPFKLVYVDGGSPRPVQDYLQTQARERGFELIRQDRYLSPNYARNLGLRYVDTKYVVFIDNDVEVTPGWLSPLVTCAEETGASVISPLLLIGKLEEQIIHSAGGEAHVKVNQQAERSSRKFHEKMYGCNKPVATMQQHLHRQETELAEFHCMFIRTAIFEQVGCFDEGLLNTREHLDFCMLVRQAGGTVYLEPASVITYVPGPPLEWTDILFYMLRWSDAWAIASMRHFYSKWNLDKDETKLAKSTVEFRRKWTLLNPLIHRLTFGQDYPLVKKVVYRLDKLLNRYLTDRYARKYSSSSPHGIAPSQAQTTTLAEV